MGNTRTIILKVRVEPQVAEIIDRLSNGGSQSSILRRLIIESLINKGILTAEQFQELVL